MLRFQRRFFHFVSLPDIYDVFSCMSCIPGHRLQLLTQVLGSLLLRSSSIVLRPFLVWMPSGTPHLNPVSYLSAVPLVPYQ